MYPWAYFLLGCICTVLVLMLLGALTLPLR